MTQSLKFAALVCCLPLLGCPKAVPDAHVVTAHGEGLEGGPDGGPRAPQKSQLDLIDDEVGAWLAQADDALWKHWTTGAKLELPTGHDALFSKATLDVLRADKSVRARHLQGFITSQLLSRALTTDTEAIASLEAAATFTVDGREVPWRDLPRLLVTEKSAVKRRALWNGSAQVVERLEALLEHRDAKAREVMSSFDVPSSLELWLAVREVNADALAGEARALLAQTDDAWRQTLTTLSAADLKLPVDALTRADLPRLFKVPAAIDAAFPKAQEPALALDTLTALGLNAQPGLTLDLAEGGKKKPLPLTVAPKPGDVRVSFKPAGGLRDVTQLLTELGTALALHGAATGHASTDRLGDPAHALVLAEVFASLVESPEWLTARGVSQAQVAGIVAAARAERLFSLRRACLLVLLRLETEGLPDADVHTKAAQLAAHALGVKLGKEDAQRLHVELDEELRAGTQLKAALQAALVREQLGPSWFTSMDPLNSLMPKLASGTAEASWPTGAQGEAVTAIVRQLGVVGSSADGGVDVPAP